MLWRVSVFLFTPLFSCLAQTGQDQTAAIIGALRSGAYSQAKQLLDSALKQSPQDPRLWTLDGLTLARLDKQQEALAAYQRALGIAPDYLAALEGAAQIEYQNGNSSAIPLLERILVSRPNDETSHAMLGTLYYRQKNCKESAANFGLSPNVISAQKPALEEYGSCLVKLKRVDDAITVFKRLAELSQDERSLYNLAVVESLAGQSQEVISTLHPVLEKNPPDAEALDLAAETYEAIANTPKAVALLRQAILADPNVARYYLDFANISLAHASYQVGVDMLKAGIERLPKDSSLYLARGILYIQLGKFDQAGDDFAKAEELNPNGEYSSGAQGLADLQQNNLGQAESTIRERLSRHPGDAFLHYLLAETLARKGAAAGSPQYKEALDSASKAVALQPNFGLARDVLGRLYLEEGNTAEAIKQSRLAFQYDPTDQTALYHLILALRKGGETSEVPALLKKLAKLREEAQRKEARERKYALVETTSPAENPK